MSDLNLCVFVNMCIMLELNRMVTQQTVDKKGRGLRKVGFFCFSHMYYEQVSLSLSLYVPFVHVKLIWLFLNGRESCYVYEKLFMYHDLCSIVVVYIPISAGQLNLLKKLYGRSQPCYIPPTCKPFCCC